MGSEQFTAMIGRTMAAVYARREDDVMLFTATDGMRFRFYHSQEDSESVAIEDICGDLSDLVGSPIVEAEEVSSDGEPSPQNADSYTWTFYKFSTVKGSVTVRWLGKSNGYYSEKVSYEVLGEP